MGAIDVDMHAIIIIIIIIKTNYAKRRSDEAHVYKFYKRPAAPLRRRCPHLQIYSISPVLLAR